MLPPSHVIANHLFSPAAGSTTAAIQHLALLVVTVSIFIFFVAILGICWWQIEKEQKVSANLHHSMSVYKDAHEAATINALSTLSILDNVFSRSGFISRSTRAKGPATELATPKQQSKLGKVGSTFSAKVHSRLATKVYSKVYATKTSSLVKKSNSRPT